MECGCCLNWYHVKCGDISDDEYRIIGETVWYCRKCIAIRDKNKSEQQVKLFLRYVDNIVRTVKGDPEKVLRAANLLHPNLQFTIETPKTNCDTIETTKPKEIQNLLTMPNSRFLLSLSPFLSLLALLAGSVFFSNPETLPD